MAFHDRFYTPKTAKAILSWRIAVGVGVAVAMGVAGLAIPVAVGLGLGVYLALVAAAVPRSPAQATIDPFTLSEPWRQLIQGAQGSRRRLRDTVAGAAGGPLRSQLDGVVQQVDHGLDEAWAIARRGDSIDDVVRRLDPTALRSKLATTQQRAAADPTPENTAAVASLEEQLASAERLKQQSESTAASLRLTQTRLDELVARAGEVVVGAADTDTYAKDVDDLVLQLEALRLAVDETRTA